MGGICTKVRGVECRRPKYGEMRIAYKFKTGEYCARAGGEDFREVRAIEPGLKTIGIYYDDPEKVDSKNSRYVVGAILSEGGDTSFTSEASVEKKFEQNGYKFATLPEAETAIQTTFPLCDPNSRIAYAIAACKVYKVFGSYIKDNKLRWNPAIEIYEREFIHFMVPQSDGEKFCVPEMTYNGTYIPDKEWNEWHE